MTNRSNEPASGVVIRVARRGFCPAIALLLVGTGISGAHAQSEDVCRDGRVLVSETDPHCCWPTQEWSEDRGRCEGPAVCPSGWAAHGDDCVPGVVQAEVDDRATVPAPAASDAGLEPEVARSSGFRDYTPPSTSPPTRPTWPLVAMGIGSFVVAYLVGLVAAAAAEENGEVALVPWCPSRSRNRSVDRRAFA
jgi:hypothetical protein